VKSPFSAFLPFYSAFLPFYFAEKAGIWRPLGCPPPLVPPLLLPLMPLPVEWELEDAEDDVSLCEVCAREIPLTFHLLIPLEQHARY